MRIYLVSIRVFFTFLYFSNLDCSYLYIFFQRLRTRMVVSQSTIVNDFVYCSYLYILFHRRRTLP